MKLNLAKIQLLDVLLNVINYKFPTHKFKLIIKLDNHIVSANFFKDYKEIQPILESFENDLFFEYPLKSKMTEYAEKFDDEFKCNDAQNRKLIESPYLLLNYLENLVFNLNDLVVTQNFIFNVNFIDSNIKLDFYQLDSSKDYEVVSILKI